MGGIFGFFDYNKAGPGVPDNEPPKSRIRVFFEVYFRKFMSLVNLNLLYFIFNLPAIFLSVFFISSYYVGDAFSDDFYAAFWLRAILGMVFVGSALITLGPVQAGFTYILRNFAKEEHAFIWWDFKEHALKNLKQGLIVTVIDILVASLGGIIINLYMVLNTNNSMFMKIATGFIIMSLVLYMIMHMYIYPMMVTFKLSIKQLYKNALMLAMIKFLPSLAVWIVCSALIVLAFGIYPILGAILSMFILMSTVGYITNFHVYPTIKKYMLDENDNK